MPDYKKLRLLTINGETQEVRFELPRLGGIDVSQMGVSIPSGSFQTIDLYTAPKTGMFVGYLYANFAAKAGGVRYLHFMRDNYELAGQKVDQPTNATTHLDVPVINWVDEGQVLQAYVYQSSGAALNITRLTLTGIIIDSTLE